MKKSLPEFIVEVGAEEAAKLFGAKVRTVESWRRRERVPRPAKAADIIAATNGVVDYAGIYGAPEQTAAA